MGTGTKLANALIREAVRAHKASVRENARWEREYLRRQKQIERERIRQEKEDERIQKQIQAEQLRVEKEEFKRGLEYENFEFEKRQNERREIRLNYLNRMKLWN